MPRATQQAAVYRPRTADDRSMLPVWPASALCPRGPVGKRDCILGRPRRKAAVFQMPSRHCGEPDSI